MSVNVKCDRSKCRSVAKNANDYNPGPGWRVIKIYEVSHRNQRSLHVCPKCSKVLGISDLPSDDLGQQLLDIVYDICKEVMEEAQ